MKEPELHESSDQTGSHRAPREGRHRRVRRRLTRLAVGVAVIVALPHIVANTPLRNVVLSGITAKRGLRVSAESASFGWISSVKLRGIRAAHTSRPLQSRVGNIELERSWLGTLLQSPDLGHVLVEDVEVEVLWPLDASPPEKRTPGRATGTFEVRRGSFQLRDRETGEPIVAFHNIDLEFGIEQQADSRVLVLPPLTVLDGTELTPELCHQGLQLVAPVLANAANVQGEASLQFDGATIPLDFSDSRSLMEQMSLRGTAELHEVTVSARESLFGDSVAVIANLLRVDLPEKIRVADNTRVDFEVREGRVHHQGLTFLLPEISADMMWQTSGSVGLDETLDLTVAVQVPFSLAGENPLTRRLTEKPIQFQIVGTLDDPQIQFPQDRAWLREAAGIVLDEALSDEARPLADAAIDLLEQLRDRRSEAGERNGPSVLDKMRERLKKRRDARRGVDESEPE